MKRDSGSSAVIFADVVAEEVKQIVWRVLAGPDDYVVSPQSSVANELMWCKTVVLT